MKLKVANLRKLLYLMEERQCVYLKRKAGEPFPWTEDEILQRYRFCNTYREQDKETVWLRENWLEPYAQHDNLWFACAMFRQINWSPTLAEVGFPEDWDPERVMKVMKARMARGEKTYTSAYMLPEIGCKSKTDYTVTKVLDPLWKSTGQHKFYGNFGTLQDAHQWLNRYYGFGGFLAYEVVTDWRHTRYLKDAADIYTWAHTGPGAKRGLCRLMGAALTAPIYPEDQLALMQKVYAWVHSVRDCKILPTLEMRDIEHSLCEYDKYCRAIEREKASKATGLERFRKPLWTLTEFRP